MDAKPIRYIVTSPSTVEELKELVHKSSASLPIVATPELDELSIRRGEVSEPKSFTFIVIDIHLDPYFVIVQDQKTLKTTTLIVKNDEIAFTTVVSDDES